MLYHGQTQAIHDKPIGRLGILLTNLGTPEAPTAQALRPYLREFLSDPRVIELPKWKWWPILHGIILRVRPAKSAKLYESIWTEQGSPLMKISLNQCQALQTKIQAAVGAEAVSVKLAMRYGQPAIGKVLREFQAEGINRIVVLPLYPQYSGATVGSTFDAVAKEIQTWRWMPELHFINSYHDHPLYIAALANSLREHFSEHGKPEKVVFSYHGMPQRYYDNGDPYACFCHKSSRLVAEQLSLQDSEYLSAFQSLFGKEEWIKPYTSNTLEALAKSGTRSVAVICPGFSADCLETIEEIAVENKAVFQEAGGQSYHYVPALNARGDHIDMMFDLVKAYLPKEGAVQPTQACSAQ